MYMRGSHGRAGCAVTLCVCENSDGWLGVWGVSECWFVPPQSGFSLALFLRRQSKPSNSQDSEQRSTQQRATARGSANQTKPAQTPTRYTRVKGTSVPPPCGLSLSLFCNYSCRVDTNYQLGKSTGAFGTEFIDTPRKVTQEEKGESTA